MDRQNGCFHICEQYVEVESISNKTGVFVGGCESGVPCGVRNTVSWPTYHSGTNANSHISLFLGGRVGTSTINSMVSIQCFIMFIYDRTKCVITVYNYMISFWWGRGQSQRAFKRRVGHFPSWAKLELETLLIRSHGWGLGGFGRGSVGSDVYLVTQSREQAIYHMVEYICSAWEHDGLRRSIRYFPPSV